MERWLFDKSINLGLCVVRAEYKIYSNNMKWRAPSSQNSQRYYSLQSIPRKQTPSILNDPIPNARMRTIAAECLQSYQIDLTKRRGAENYQIQAKAVVQLQRKLKTKASQFISRIANERMQLKGRAILRKQEEEQKRLIKLEIDRYERTLREKKELLERQEKHEQKAQFYQWRAQQRHLHKIRQRKQASLIQSHSNSKAEAQSPKPNRSLRRQPKSQQSQLRNEIYLDQQQQRVELARKRLIQLQSTIQNVERLRYEC